MTGKPPKGRRIRSDGKTGSEVPVSKCRVVVFEPSPILTQRINGDTPVNVAE
jgi:hypothetical protein